MVTIILPWPPSVNTYWRSFRGRVVLSKKGVDYRKAVCEQVAEQAVGKFGSEKIEMSIEAFRPDNRKRDLDNILKSVLDSLAHAGVYDDDSQIHKLTVFWGPHVGGYAKVRISCLSGSTS
ncbi:RusA family crossover junction endodeoxyribonuclease [bacterium]|nr:RusA family crossover junction endodeoxyribonuclease [bacterium]